MIFSIFYLLFCFCIAGVLLYFSMDKNSDDKNNSDNEESDNIEKEVSCESK